MLNSSSKAYQSIPLIMPASNEKHYARSRFFLYLLASSSSVLLIAVFTSSSSSIAKDQKLRILSPLSLGSSASQGTVWRPQRIRSYSSVKSPTILNKTSIPSPSFTCTNWAVITTIFLPTALCKQLANLHNWCLVVVGDEKTKQEAWSSFAKSSPATYYLSPSDQRSLPYATLSHLKWNHFGRKNIGYLFAIHHGASYIWDTDDDNLLKNPALLNSLVDITTQHEIPFASAKHHLWNPYHIFNPVCLDSAKHEQLSWPRGFPLEYIKDHNTYSISSHQTLSPPKIGVLQSLADNDPDVDGIYRLTKPIPFSFISRNTTYALHSNQYSPFNAQATLWTQKAFWAMLMPVSVHGRVTDIWRSYITECLMKNLDQHVAFTSPIVIQYRNPHTYIGDLHAEIPLYTKANELTKWLASWRPIFKKSPSLASIMEQLIISLYEIGVVEEEDVSLYQAWLQDLKDIRYQMPSLLSSSSAVKPTESETTIQVKDVDVVPHVSTAVCVSGQLRTLTMPISHENYPAKWGGMTATLPPANMTVAESIQTNLFTKLGNVDVFMYVSTREGEQEPKEGDSSVCEALRPAGGHLVCSVPKEETIEAYNTNMWKTFQLAKDPPAIQGLLQQLKGMLGCYEMIQNHSRVMGKKYDWTVRLRPDVYMHSFPDLKSLVLESMKPTVWYANRKTCCCGNDDTFGIAPSNLMGTYFERLLHLQQSGWNFSARATWNAESFLKTILYTRGISLKGHDDINACVVKPINRKERGDP